MLFPSLAIRRSYLMTEHANKIKYNEWLLYTMLVVALVDRGIFSFELNRSASCCIEVATRGGVI